jgi:hypothetical protein
MTESITVLQNSATLDWEMTAVNSGSLKNFAGVYFLLKLTGINNRIQKGVCGKQTKLKRQIEKEKAVISFSNESEHIFV